MDIFKVCQALWLQESTEEFIVEEFWDSREINCPQAATVGEEGAGQTVVNNIKVTTPRHPEVQSSNSQK